MQLNLKHIFSRTASGKTVVVVELGNDWLKVVELKDAKRLTVLSAVKLSGIKGTVSQAIEAIFRERGIKKKSVITYIPRHLATVRMLDMPSTDLKEINDIIGLQVGKQTPYSKEEIISGYLLTDSDKEGYSGVILAIIRRTLITERLEALEKAGLAVEKVALSSEGVYRWFQCGRKALGSSGQRQVSALVDIDSNYSDFILIENQRLIFTKSILIGANQFQEDFPQWLEKFIDELKRSIELYQVKDSSFKIHKLVLSGARGSIKDLDIRLSSALDIPVDNLDSFKDVKIEDSLRLSETAKGLSFTPLIGIAQAPDKLGIDLTPAQIILQKALEEKRRNLTFAGILIASIVLMASLLLLLTIYNKNLYLEAIRKNTEQLRPRASQAEKVCKAVEMVEQRLNTRGSALDILNAVYKVTPGQIYLVSILIEDRKQAILKGRAAVMSDVFKYITTLEESAYFENVKSTYTTTRKEDDKEYAEFEVICSYQEE